MFTERTFDLVIEGIQEGEAVWFNKDMLGFYVPMPSGPYLEDNLLPNLQKFSDSDQFGILYTMSKMTDV